MKVLSSILILSILLPSAEQDDSARAARELIEKLHSDKIDEREQAARKLKEMGSKALPELTKASDDNDAEVAGRMRLLARAILIAGKLTHNLLKAIPGIDDRLADHSTPAWAELLLQVAPINGERLGYPGLKRSDLEVLANLALTSDCRIDEKIKACRSISHWKIGAKGSVLALILKDKDSDLREAALEVVESIRATELIPSVLDCYSVSKDKVRLRAARVLGVLGDKGSSAQIMGLLQSDDEETRWVGLRVLGDLDAIEYSAEIRKSLLDNSDVVRSEVVGTLTRLRVDLLPFEIAQFVTQSSDRVTTSYLPTMGARQAVSQLEQLLRDKKSGVRARAVEVLGSARVQEAAPQIIALLSDEDAEVRASAAWALAELKVKGAIPEIRKLLKAKPGEYSSILLSALGHLAASEALPDMLPFIRHTDDSIRSMAVEAIGMLGSKDAIPDLLPLLKDGNQSVRAFTCIALRSLDARETAPEIAKLMLDPTGQVRGWSAYALETLGTKELIPDLMALLEVSELAKDSIEALSTLGARESIPRLRAFLKDENIELRDAALQALGKLSALETSPDIVPFLENACPSTCQRAVQALDQLAFADAAPVVENLLSDGSPDVRAAAAAFLCHRGSMKGALPCLLESDNLMPLNALRQPELWRKMNSKKLTGSVRGSVKVSLERLTREVDVALSLPSGESGSELWQSKEGGYYWPTSGMTILEAIESVLLNCAAYRDGKADRAYQVVLEPGLVRILPRREALKFWREWTKSQPQSQDKK